MPNILISGTSFPSYRAAWVNGRWQLIDPKPPVSPIEQLLVEIENALKARFYFLALVLAVALPDICAALESESGETSSVQYKRWYNDNVASRIPGLTNVDAYSLRCGVIHQGKFGHPKMQFDRLLFFLPGPVVGLAVSTHLNHDGTYSGSISVVEFCKYFIQAVRDWYKAKHNDPNVRENLPRLVQYRPNGLAPYIVGQAVIA